VTFEFDVGSHAGVNWARQARDASRRVAAADLPQDHGRPGEAEGEVSCADERVEVANKSGG
jgi:hypothetical protein